MCLSLPFLKERSSDENTFAPCVMETLSLLGSMMMLQCESLRQQVAQTVADFYCTESNTAQAEGMLAYPLPHAQNNRVLS